MSFSHTKQNADIQSETLKFYRAF